MLKRIVAGCAVAAFGVLGAVAPAQADSFSPTFDCQTSAGHWKGYLNYNGTDGHIINGRSWTVIPAETGSHATVYLQAYQQITSNTWGWVTKDAYGFYNVAEYYRIWDSSNSALFNTQTDSYKNGQTGRMRLKVAGASGVSPGCESANVDVYAPRP